MNFSNKRRSLIQAGLYAGGALISVPLLSRAATNFPAKPITLIVPFPAGGTADTTYRVLAKAAEPHLGQSIVVENRAGASATLGAVAIANAAPDGYRLTVTHSAVLRMQLMQDTSYDALKDFDPIIQISALNVGMLVRQDSPFRNWGDFIEAARRNPDKVSYGTNGVATAQNLAMIQIAEQEKVKLNHIPYKGDAEATTGLLGGHIDAHAGGTGLGSLVDGGKARWLALFSDVRLSRWPDVPTLYDLGYNVPASSPTGIMGPAGMPPEVIATLHDAFKKALYTPEHVHILEQSGQAVQYRDSAGFAELIKEHYGLERERIDKAGLLAQGK